MDVSVIDLKKSRQRWPVNIILRRIAWLIAQPLMLLPTRQMSFLRIGILRLFGATIGANCLIMSKVRVLMPWNLVLDDFVAIGNSVEIYNFAQVRIRRMTVISQRCYICTGSHDYTNPTMPLIWKPIGIGEECWVAAEAFIAPGVTVANGVVVGARSVVTKSIESPWSVWAGNPAKHVKNRAMKDSSES